MATDAEIRAAGLYAIPQQKYLQNPFQLPTNEVVEEETESFGIPNTNAFTNSGGGGGGVQGLDPYNRPQGKPLDPNSFLGKTFTGLKDFGGTVVDKFSGLPGVEQGKGFIRNIMDNTMIGRFAAMRNPLNPNASNYNKALQGQIDYLSGLSVDGNMMIGRDPGTGLGKYGPDSALSGQNVVSGFGTNDYGKQLQKNLERLEGYKNPGDKTREMIEKTKQEMKDLEEEDDKNYQNRIDNFVKNYNRPGVKEMFDKVYDGNNIHNNPPGTPPGGGDGGGGGPIDGFGITSAGNYTNQFEGGDPGQSSGNMSASDFSDDTEGTPFAKGGRAGYFFGGRVNYKAGGRVSFKNGGLASIL